MVIWLDIKICCDQTSQYPFAFVVVGFFGQSTYLQINIFSTYTLHTGMHDYTYKRIFIFM